MSRTCEVTGKKRLIANKVSHSNIKTKKAKQVNLKNKWIFDPATGQKVRLKLSAAGIRTLDKVGSLTKLLKSQNYL